MFPHVPLVDSSIPMNVCCVARPVMSGHLLGLRCKDYFETRKLVEFISLCGEVEESGDELRVSLRIITC